MRHLKRFVVALLLAASYVAQVTGQCASTDGFLTAEPTPNVDDEYYFINLTVVANGETRYGEPLIMNLMSEENLNVTLFSPSESFTGIWKRWNFGNNGDIPDGAFYLLADASTIPDNMVGSITLYFDPPVNSVAMKTNYDPSFEANQYGIPKFSTLGSNGAVQDCYNIANLAPISTPGESSGFDWRGVTNPAGIYAMTMGGGNIGGWDIVIIRYPPPPVAPVTPPPQATPVAAPVQDTPVEVPVAAPVVSQMPVTAPVSKSNNPTAKTSDGTFNASFNILLAVSVVLLVAH